MVKRYGFRGTLAIKYKIDFWNNPITASVLGWNQVVLNQSQQLGYLNSKLMLSWHCPFKGGLFPLILHSFRAHLVQIFNGSGVDGCSARRTLECATHVQQCGVDVFAVAEPKRLDGDFARHQAAAAYSRCEGQRRGWRLLAEGWLVPVRHHLAQEGRVITTELLRIPLLGAEGTEKSQIISSAALIKNQIMRWRVAATLEIKRTEESRPDFHIAQLTDS